MSAAQGPDGIRADGGGVRRDGYAAMAKEALDAAHGHEHNEDGSKMTDAQLKAAEPEDGHDHAGEAGAHALSRPLMIYAGVLTLLFLLTAQRLWNQRRT